MLIMLFGFALAILQRIVAAVVGLLRFVVRLVLIPFRLVFKAVYFLVVCIVALSTLFARLVASCLPAETRTLIKHYLIVPEHMVRTRRNSNDPDPEAGPSSSHNEHHFRPRNIHRARAQVQRLKSLAWRSRRLLCLVAVFTTATVLCIVTSTHASSVSVAAGAAAVTDSQLQHPDVTVADWDAKPVSHHVGAATASGHQNEFIGPHLVSDYANYLVDKLGLDADASWLVRNVETTFDYATFHADPVYPNASHPVDTQSLPSLKRAHSKLDPGGSGGSGFAKVHVPGFAAVQKDVEHQRLLLRNDYGEEYEPDVKGKKKQELYGSGKLPRPLPPGPPEGFVLRWPPERVIEVAEENERAARFFEELERQRMEQEEQARREMEEQQRQEGQEEGQEGQEQGQQEQPDQQQQEQQQPDHHQNLKRDLQPRDEPDAPANDDHPPPPVKQHPLTTTKPLLKAAGKPLRLLSSGRGMLQKMLSRSGNASESVDNNNDNDIIFETSAVDLSPVLFVISTTYGRLANNDWALLDDWARYMTNGRGRSNGAFALVSLHRPRGDELDTVAAKLRARGIFHHLREDAGDVHEGIGGGRDDTDPLPPVPDPEAVRYANALTWAKEYSSRHAHAQRHTVFALIDDDAFVVNAPQLLATLQAHGLVVDGAHGLLRPEIEARRNRDMYLAFPSDPYSDWHFHNRSTHASLYDDEVRNHGNATTTADMPLRYRLVDSSSANGTDGSVSVVDPVDPAMVFPTSYGGGAVFMAAELAMRMADLPCLRRSTPDGFRNDMYKSGRVDIGWDGRPEPGWDEQLFHCARAHMPTLQLHVVPSFYAPADAALYGDDTQDALHDDAGFGRVLGRMHQYTGGTRPLVMHNHRTWHQFDAGAAHQITDVCGDDCFLQRYEFDDNWVLTNGHSLIHFPDGRGPGTNSLRVPRREILPDTEAGAANPETYGTFIPPVLNQRASTYRELLAFYETAGLVVEQAPRPPGSHVDVLDLDARRQTYKLLDTSVAADGTVMQAYVRRRDHGDELFVDGPPGGRAAFERRAKYMAVPRMARGGLEGDDEQAATEDAPPVHDEVVLLLWRPAGAPAKPSRFSSLLFGVPSSPSLADNNARYAAHAPAVWCLLWAWTCLKLALVCLVVARLAASLQDCLASAAALHPAWYTPAGVLLAMGAAWSAAVQSVPRRVVVPAFAAVAALATYLDDLEMGVCVFGMVFAAVHAVLVLARTLTALQATAVPALTGALLSLAEKMSAEGSRSSINSINSINSNRSSSSNSNTNRSSDPLGDLDVSDVEEDLAPLHYLYPPTDAKHKSC